MNEFKSYRSYWKFAFSVRHNFRFVRTAEVNDFLCEIVRTSESRIENLPMRSLLWRAQLGHEWKPLDQNGVRIDDIPSAYCPERMKPLPNLEAEGRINPKGIPVLYLSTKRDTAMSEVRPWLGSLVSCAQFKTKRDLRIVDCSLRHDEKLTIYFEEPDAQKKEAAVWRNIDQAFSHPVDSCENPAGYVPTQIIAELFKEKGYDGIAYKSMFGDDGYNVALFNPDDAELVTCCLFEANSIDISFRQTDNPYWVEADGNKTLSVDVIGPAKMTD